MEPWLTLNYSAEKLIKYLNRQESYLHQFDIQQQVVGVICTRYPWLYGAYIELFAVYESQQFYQKMGFVEIGQIDDFVMVGYDEILLRKSLIL